MTNINSSNKTFLTYLDFLHCYIDCELVETAIMVRKCDGLAVNMHLPHPVNLLVIGHRASQFNFIHEGFCHRKLRVFQFLPCIALIILWFTDPSNNYRLVIERWLIIERWRVCVGWYNATTLSPIHLIFTITTSGVSLAIRVTTTRISPRRKKSISIRISPGRNYSSKWMRFYWSSFLNRLWLDKYLQWEIFSPRIFSFFQEYILVTEGGASIVFGCQWLKNTMATCPTWLSVGQK